MLPSKRNYGNASVCEKENGKVAKQRTGSQQAKSPLIKEKVKRQCGKMGQQGVDNEPMTL